MTRAIRFTAAEVRATLDGSKVAHRVPIKPDWWRCLDPDDEDDRATAMEALAQVRADLGETADVGQA